MVLDCYWIDWFGGSRWLMAVCEWMVFGWCWMEEVHGSISMGEAWDWEWEWGWGIAQGMAEMESEA